MLYGNDAYNNRCVYCGATFVDTDIYSNVCNSCKELSSDINHKPHRGSIEVNCIYCGSNFVTTYSRLRNGKGKYCSNSCYNSDKKHRRTGENAARYNSDRVTVICKTCEKPFSVTRISFETRPAVFCSKECQKNLKYKEYDRNTIIKNGNVIKLEVLSNDMISPYYIIIDTDDYDKIKMYKWSVVNGNNHTTCYAVTNIKIDGTYKMVRMHSLIMSEVRTGCIIDHINHNGLDNRKCNLRKCTHAENICNSRKQKNSHSSIFKGVHLVARSKRYTSHIRINGKLKSIGTYNDEIDAAIAYDYAAVCLFGEFAYLNFPFLKGYYEEVPQYIVENVNIGIHGKYKELKCSSIYTGVSKCKHSAYKSEIKVDGVIKYLGTYPNEIHAAMVRDLYVIENNLKRKLNFSIIEISNYFEIDGDHDI